MGLAVPWTSSSHRVVVRFGTDSIIKVGRAGETIRVVEIIEQQELGTIGCAAGEGFAGPEPRVVSGVRFVVGRQFVLGDMPVFSVVGD